MRRAWEQSITRVLQWMEQSISKALQWLQGLDHAERVVTRGSCTGRCGGVKRGNRQGLSAADVNKLQ